MDPTQHYRSIFRVRKVILSCRTLPQLAVARAMFYRLLDRCEFGSWHVQQEFIRLLNEQERRIKHEQFGEELTA